MRTMFPSNIPFRRNMTKDSMGEKAPGPDGLTMGFSKNVGISSISIFPMLLSEA